MSSTRHIIADHVILEIKAAEDHREENRAQLINYLKANAHNPACSSIHFMIEASVESIYL